MQQKINKQLSGSGQLVAVALNRTNRVMTSLDGVTWTARPAAERNTWLSVTHGNGLFVAVSEFGTNKVMTSAAKDVATLTLNNNADPYVNANDVSDITFDFVDSAFVAESANEITNATAPASSNLGVDFEDPFGLTVAISDASISEAGCKATATVNRNSSTAAALNIALTSSNPGEAVVPGNTTIAAGQNSVSVIINSMDENLIDGLKTVAITASVTNLLSGSDVVDVRDDDDLDGDGVANFSITAQV